MQVTMSKTKQTTLFQSWGAKSQAQQQQQQQPQSRAATGQEAGSSTCSRQGVDQVVDLSDEVDDEDLMLALAMERSLQETCMSDSAASADQSRNITERDRTGHGPTVMERHRTGHSSTVAAASSSLFRSVGRASVTAPAHRHDDGQSHRGAARVGAAETSNLGLVHHGADRHDSSCDESTVVNDLPGFDMFAGRMWIYPTNYPVRDYQFSIVQQALFHNTLVILPTGLGKTFVAAVVMYNFYRWYPTGKIVFMAPTKPLVAQQIEACYNIMGIPQDDTAEMTGAMLPAARLKAWRQRRVFFLTPQVVMNDLSRSACPAEEVKCLVVDEAHKATGNHAYCQVVKELVKHSQQFRMVALSATPGSDIKAVQKVVTNLVISHIELRTEESADIKPYAHERKVDKIVVPLGEELTAIREKYMKIVDVVVMRLRRQSVLYNRDSRSMSKFMILKARDGFRQNPPPNLQRAQFGIVEGDFALCMSLYHGYELLQLHGLRSLYNFLEGLASGDKGYGRTRAELQRNSDFCEVMETLRSKFDPIKGHDPNVSIGSTPGPSQLNAPFEVGHPKMTRLQEIVLEHFHVFLQKQKEQDESHSAMADPKSPNTRIMIFSQYRDSVNEITEMLNRHRPLVKVMSFIGQSSAGKSARGFTQKEQLKVMKRFREGGYNTLVSTCVGEEGLDIGDVDLIICFDAHKSPIRLVQRMGRTGRKREGRIVMLVTQGKEEQVYNQSQYSKNSIHRAILNGAKSLVYHPNNPRMVPQGLQPQCHRMHLSLQAAYQAQKKGKVKATAAQGAPLDKDPATDTGNAPVTKRGRKRKSKDAEVHEEGASVGTEPKQKKSRRQKPADTEAPPARPPRPRRSDTLPQLETDIDLDSDDDLPVFNPRSSMAEGTTVEGQTELVCQDQQNPVVLSLSRKTKQQKKPRAKKASTSSGHGRMTASVKGCQRVAQEEREAQDGESAAQGGHGAPQPDGQGKAKRKRKKKSVEVQRPIIDLIDDQDREDFLGAAVDADAAAEEGPIMATSDDMLEEATAEPAGGAKDDLQAHTSAAADADADDDADASVSGNISTAIDSEPEVLMECEEGCLADSGDEDPQFSQMFAISPFPDYLVSDKPKSPRLRESPRSCTVIKPPPPFEQIDSIFEDLDRKGHLSPVDILEVIDQWEKDKLQVIVENVPVNSKTDSNSPRHHQRNGDIVHPAVKCSVSACSLRVDTRGNMDRRKPLFKSRRSNVKPLEVDTVLAAYGESDQELASRSSVTSEVAYGLQEESILSPELPQVLPDESSVDSKMLWGIPSESTSNVCDHRRSSAKCPAGSIMAQGLPAKTRLSPVPAQCLPARTNISPILAQGLPAKTSISPILAQGLPAKTSISPILAQGLPANTSISPILAQGLSANTSISPILAQGLSANTSISPILAQGLSANTGISPILAMGLPAGNNVIPMLAQGLPANTSVNKVSPQLMFSESLGEAPALEKSARKSEEGPFGCKSRPSPKLGSDHPTKPAQVLKNQGLLFNNSERNDELKPGDSAADAQKVNPNFSLLDSFAAEFADSMEYESQETSAAPLTTHAESSVIDSSCRINIPGTVSSCSNTMICDSGSAESAPSALCQISRFPNRPCARVSPSVMHQSPISSTSCAPNLDHHSNNRHQVDKTSTPLPLGITSNTHGSREQVKNLSPLPFAGYHGIVKSSVKHAHDSFFEDDSVLAEVAMPTASELQDLERNARDTSQITFSQALASVHDSINRSKHSSTSGSTSLSGIWEGAEDNWSGQGLTTHACNLERSDATSIMTPSLRKGESAVQTCAKSPSEPAWRPPKTHLVANTENSGAGEEDVQPHFDLGFDLDEDEDEDEGIISPSPPKSTQPFSQYRMLANLRTSVASGTPTNHKPVHIAEPDASSETVGACSTDALSATKVPRFATPPRKANVASLMNVPRGSDDRLGLKSIITEVSVSDPEIREARNNSANHTLGSINRSKVSSGSPAGCPIDTNVDMDQNHQSSNIDQIHPSSDLWDKDGDTLDFDVDLETELVEADKSSEEEEEEEDADDSFIQVRKKKTGVITSPDTPESRSDAASKALSDGSPEFKTPCRPAPRVKGPTNTNHQISSLANKEQTQETKSRQLPVFEIPDDNDDFVTGAKTKPHRGERDLAALGRARTELYRAASRTKTKTSSRRPRCAFLEVEAELSSDEAGSSDDEDDSDLDQMDASFINDTTALSQSASESVDMRAVYLRSVKSPTGAIYRAPRARRCANMDVFSQVPEEASHEDEYMEDSFCVGEGFHDTACDEDEDSEDTQEADETCAGPRTRLQRFRHLKRRDRPCKTSRAGSGRRRIVHMATSSSEDEAHGTEASPHQASDRANVRRITSDSGESSASTVGDASGGASPHLDDAGGIGKGAVREKGKGSRQTSSSDRSRSSSVVCPPVLSHTGTVVTSSGSKNVAAASVTDTEPSVSQRPSLHSRCLQRMTTSSLTRSSKLAIAVNQAHTSSHQQRTTTRDDSSSFLISSKLATRTGQMRPSSVASGKKSPSEFETPGPGTHPGAVSRNAAGGLELSQEDTPVFSLGLDDDFGDDDDDDDVDDQLLGNLPLDDLHHSAQPRMRPVLDTLRLSHHGVTKGSNPTLASSFSSSRSVCASLAAPSAEQSDKAERLRLCRLKQEQFRRARSSVQRGAEDHNANVSAAASNVDCQPAAGIMTSNRSGSSTRLSSTSITSTKTPTTSLRSSITSAKKASLCDVASFSPEEPSIHRPNFNATRSSLGASVSMSPAQQKMVILVDSKELSGTQDLVSALRFNHHLHTVVRSLGSCDYIVSSRMAVERKVWSDFANGSHRSKLVERMRLLSERFERPCLVLEKDRVKVGEEKMAQPLLRTKYVEQQLACLAQSHIKVLHSDSQEKTAELLADLVQLEQRKGMCIAAPLCAELSPAQEQVLKFYLSLPRLSYIAGLNLLHSFNSIGQFINSPVGVLVKKGGLSRAKAQEIHAYLHRHFDAQLMAL